MTGDNLQLGKLERHVVEIGDWAAGLGRAQRTRVTHLQAKRRSELHALGVQRVVPAIIRREVPQPRYDSQPAKSQLTHTAS